MGIDIHQDLIEKNYKYWNQKPILKILYGDFYRRIAEQLSRLPESRIVELGSGLGNIREFIPNCIRTDLFPNPWIDQIENAYQLSFANESVSDLILTDIRMPIVDGLDLFLKLKAHQEKKQIPIVAISG